jgi:hypothetical protein
VIVVHLFIRQPKRNFSNTEQTGGRIQSVIGVIVLNMCVCLYV